MKRKKGKLIQVPKITKREIHENLYFVKDEANDVIVGYVNRHPGEDAWFFFVTDTMSDFYNKADDAIHALCYAYVETRFDKMAKVIQNNEG